MLAAIIYCLTLFGCNAAAKSIKGETKILASVNLTNPSTFKRLDGTVVFSFNELGVSENSVKFQMSAVGSTWVEFLIDLRVALMNLNVIKIFSKNFMM